MLPRTYTVADVHKMTGIPRRTIYDAIERGELRATVFNGNKRGKRMLEEWVLDWIKETRR